MAGGPYWSDADLKWLRENYGNNDVVVLARHLGRSPMAVYRKAFDEGLTKRRPAYGAAALRYNAERKLGQATVQSIRRLLAVAGTPHVAAATARELRQLTELASDLELLKDGETD